MRKLTLIFTLALAGAAMAQQPVGFGSTPAAAPQKRKEIKDPNEYNAYISATQERDEKMKAGLLEKFVQQYPNSVVKVDALEQLMAAAEKTNDVPMLMEAAHRVLESDANNLRALALLAYLKRQAVASAKPDEVNKTLAEAAEYAQRGLQAEQSAVKPDGVTDAEFQSLKTETSAIFNGVTGFAALQNKDYSSAQQHLQEAVNANPNNLADLYPLAVAYLAGWPPPAPAKQLTTLSSAGSPARCSGHDRAALAAQAAPPATAVLGIWNLVRAASVSSDTGQKMSILGYGRFLFIKYHGDDEGWQALTDLAAKHTAPPAGFTIRPRPTPAEQAAQMADKPVKDMGFDEFEFIFTSGNQEAAEKVWDEIKDKPIAFEAKVEAASPTKLTLSASAEDIADNACDVEVTMILPLPAKSVPREGNMTAVSGTPIAYSANPFMITMSKGALLKQ